MNIAYLRVSTDKQFLDNQRSEIEKYAAANNINIDKWYRETISGTKNSEKRIINSVLKKAKPGDTIFISEISRLSRKMFDIITIMNECIKKNITLYSVKEGFAIGDDINSKVIGFAFSLSAEIERNLISMRTKEALSARKSRGVILGRPVGSGKKNQKLLEKESEIYSRLDSKESVSNIARDIGVSRSMLYKFLKDNRQ